MSFIKETSKSHICSQAESQVGGFLLFLFIMSFLFSSRLYAADKAEESRSSSGVYLGCDQPIPGTICPNDRASQPGLLSNTNPSSQVKTDNTTQGKK